MISLHWFGTFITNKLSDKLSTEFDLKEFIESQKWPIKHQPNLMFQIINNMYFSRDFQRNFGLVNQSVHYTGRFEMSSKLLHIEDWKCRLFSDWIINFMILFSEKARIFVCGLIYIRLLAKFCSTSRFWSILSKCHIRSVLTISSSTVCVTCQQSRIVA